MGPFVFIIMVISTSISHHPSIHPHTSPSTLHAYTPNKIHFLQILQLSTALTITTIHTHTHTQLLPTDEHLPPSPPLSSEWAPTHRSLLSIPLLSALHSPAPREKKIRSQVLQLFKIQQETESELLKIQQVALCVSMSGSSMRRTNGYERVQQVDVEGGAGNSTQGSSSNTHLDEKVTGNGMGMNGSSGSNAHENGMGGGEKDAAAAAAAAAGAAGSISSIIGKYEPAVAGACYCGASMSMVLVNKHVLNSFGYSCTNSILLLQNIVSVLFVVLGNVLGLVRTEPMRMDIVTAWVPVNAIFVGMIWTGFFSLKHLGVPMVTVLKNFTNVIIIFGDKFIFGREHSAGVWFTIALLFASVICGGTTDLGFSLVGYTWQFLNCCFTAAYSLTLRGVMDKVKKLVKNPRGLDEFSMVLYNNLLSIPFVVVLMIQNGEVPRFLTEAREQPPSFFVAAGISGVVGFGISIASLWFLSRTSATTYSITGSLNKIPTVVFGYLFFATQTSFWNLLSVAFGLGAGLCFTAAKIKESQQAKVQQQLQQQQQQQADGKLVSRA